MNLSNSMLNREDLSTEGELEEIMGFTLAQLKSLAKDDEEFVRIVRLAINKGIELGRQRTALAYNRSLRERIN